ncbi:hypothetical protein Clacol_003026 [Clathrus columnatus]|uniref:Cytochrome P450 n=1 Tax=Clathrus columnatus TaxID=1419009 RepID=A0AAV5A2E7_9AGAM|nr:hypothetical protein Clacol_003026 [Clathrus columnatus]
MKEARSLGASPAPPVSRFFGIDALQKMMKSFNEGNVADYMFEWLDKYGPVHRFEFLNEYTLLTVEPEHLKTILATEFESFEKGEVFNWCFQAVLGTGVFNSDGVLWKFHRSLTRPFFSRDRITDFELFNHHADTVISKIKQRAVEQEPIDFQDLMSRFTLDSATQFLFGSCVDSLSAPLPYAWNSLKSNPPGPIPASDQFAEAFNQAQTQTAVRTRLGDLWPLLELFRDKTKDSMRTIHDYIEPILRDAISRKALTKLLSVEEKEMPETLLDSLLLVTDGGLIGLGLKLTNDERFVSIMIAGRDTTTATLTFLFYCLSQHPEVLAKLRKEIFEVVGPSGRPTYQNIKECRYLRAVINGHLTSAPSYARRALTLPAVGTGKPIYVPKGAGVGYSVYVMHRRTDLWGPDAHEFDPERFLDHRVQKYLTTNPFVFLPFNAGPRICLGQQFAYNEISLIAVRLLQAFEDIQFSTIAQPPESKPPSSQEGLTLAKYSTEKIWPKVHLTIYSHKGLWLTMKEARNF